MQREIRKFTLRTGAVVEAWIGGKAGAGPPLLMIPGVSGNKELLDCVFAPLARDRRVIVIDLSPVFERGVSILESAVRDAREIVEALRLDEFDLLGQSFGGLIAAHLTRQPPSSVRKLILAGPAVVPSSWAAPAILARWLSAGAMIRVCPRRWRPGLATVIRHSGGFPIEPELEGQGLEDLVTRVQVLRVVPLLRRLLSIHGVSWEKELAGVEAPVLVIEGSREAALLPPKLLVFFDQRPNTKYVELAGGHLPFLVRPEKFVAIVDAFLDQSRAVAQR